MTPDRVSHDGASQQQGLGRKGVMFIVLMAGLSVLFAGLGYWQTQRLAWKQDLIARVQARASAAPVALPDLKAWQGLVPDDWEYRPVVLHGHYLQMNPLYVFTALSEPKGRYGGPGFWVLSPFELDSNDRVFINRGFVPQDQRETFDTAAKPNQGVQTLTGLVRVSEETGFFTPQADPQTGTLYVRNLEQMAVMEGLEPAQFLPVYVDLSAGGGTQLPQAGETVMQFSNRHLGYVITWYGLALIVLVMTLVWFLKLRRH